MDIVKWITDIIDTMYICVYIIHIYELRVIFYIEDNANDTFWQSNLAMEISPFIDYMNIESSIYKGFPLAMFDY